MIYGYIRISTDKQSVENQRFEIEKFLRERNYIVDKYIEEVVSGTKKYSDRKLGVLLKNLKPEDILIVSELSRLGRSLMQIMSILNLCIQNQIIIISIKENYELCDNINSKVLAFAFGLSAEIERQLISQRTKEALARKKAEGKTLGRPKGLIPKPKLYAKEKYIKSLLKRGIAKKYIAKKLNVSQNTLRKFMREGDF